MPNLVGRTEANSESVESIEERAQLMYSSVSKDTLCSLLVKSEEDVQLRKLVSEDAVLDPSVEFQGGTRSPAYFQNILLTGVTGQLGPFILRELTKHVHLHVFCLIRSKNEKEAKSRLVESLRKNDILICTPLTNVHCIPGSISENNFGMLISEYYELAAKIDAIIHCAVKSAHTEIYRKYAGRGDGKGVTKHDIRSVNVFGTKRILQFATAITTKPVLYGSSFVACNRVNTDGKASESLPDKENNGDGITMGYALSKLVAEKLIEQAISRGIPCKVIRYPFISGDSVTGKFFHQETHMMCFLFACLSLGMLPDVLKYWSPVPVDVAASITVRLFLHEEAADGCYTMTNPHMASTQEIIDLAGEYGLKMEIAPNSDFLKAVANEGENSILYPYRDIYVQQEGLVSIMKTCRLAGLSFLDPAQHQISPKLLKLMPNIQKEIPKAVDSVRKNLDYARYSGLLQKLNVTAASKNICEQMQNGCTLNQ